MAKPTYVDIYVVTVSHCSLFLLTSNLSFRCLQDFAYTTTKVILTEFKGCYVSTIFIVKVYYRHDYFLINSP